MINNCYLPDIKRHQESPGGQSPRRHWAAVQRLEGVCAQPQPGGHQAPARGISTRSFLRPCNPQNTEVWTH